MFLCIFLCWDITKLQLTNVRIFYGCLTKVFCVEEKTSCVRMLSIFPFCIITFVHLFTMGAISNSCVTAISQNQKNDNNLEALLKLVGVRFGTLGKKAHIHPYTS